MPEALRLQHREQHFFADGVRQSTFLVLREASTYPHLCTISPSSLRIYTACTVVDMLSKLEYLTAHVYTIIIDLQTMRYSFLPLRCYVNTESEA